MSSDFSGVEERHTCTADLQDLLQQVQRAVEWQGLRAAHAEQTLEEARRELGRLREQARDDAAALAELRGDVARLREERSGLVRAMVTAQLRLSAVRPGDCLLSFGRDSAPPVRLVAVEMTGTWPPAPIEGEDDTDAKG
ncbi:hypothetical protein LY474_40520 [Myxococcus stipitatus]|uniref:hypothetical protein n=1 Tax=Myxococcus stipitatus TaxID=83455 RepID=UPI001F2D6BC4|nr:hypothetical protein [Myxococcus stipitatus]MCE9674093.1 hypothetical protein [Myxococcus stipitatus]